MRSFNSFMFFTLTLSLILKYPLYSLIDPDSSISFALVDGPSYHTQVNIILEENRLVWALDPLSYIGLYPMSSPLGLQTFAASLCLLLNMEVSSIAFLLSFYLTIVQFFSVFLLSRLFFRNNLINVTSA